MSALLSLCAAFASAAPPQLLVPSGVADRLPLEAQAMWSEARSIPVPGFATPGIKAKFNSAEVMGLRHGDAVELTLPDGSRHPFVLDLVEAHRDGIRTWFGKHRDYGTRYRVIATAGPTGTFAVFSTPQGEYRLVPGPSGDVLIDMDAEQQLVPAMASENDVRISPAEEAKALRTYAPEPYLPLPGVSSLPTTKAAPASGYVVDIMFVVTNALATNLGTDLLARLQFLVARANASYADSDVAIRLRYVHHVVVNYTDQNDATFDNGNALGEISPNCTAFCDSPFNSGVFGGIEALRTTYGADVVAMLRNGSNSGGAGIAWLGSRNAGSTAITNPSFMYSVTTGCVRSCESVFIHEVGHNFGLNHDRATYAWQAGGITYPPSGQYNFGYYFCATGALRCNPEMPGSCTSQPECSDVASPSPNNFSDLMAYFHASTERNYRFSNPLLNCDGDLGAGGTSGPCGQANLADAARYLNEVRAAVSAIKGTQGTYTDGTSSVTGWPPNGVLPPGFTSAGNAWTVATDRVFEGTQSLRSAQVYGSSFAFPPSGFTNSDLNFTGTFTAGTLSFMYQVSAWSSGGVGYGYIEFSIDDVVVMSDTGESGWQFYAHPITAGAHTLRWRFKNALPSACSNVTPDAPGGVNCADRAWIDAVSLPVLSASSTTTLASSPNPSTVGQSVTITATVSGSTGTPTGTVTFQSAGTNIAGCVAVALASGQAACTTTALPPGVAFVTAMYSGSSAHAASTSAPFPQFVAQGAQLLSANPTTLAFGGQSMNTTSSPQSATITNSTGSAVAVSNVIASTGYSVTHNCASLPPGGTCVVNATFTPPAASQAAALPGTITVLYPGGGPAFVALTGTAEKSLVTHYYRSILRRAPDAGGKAFWEGEATRVGGLGANVNEVWYAMAQTFYFSTEYAAFNRSNAAFVTDLYNTFFNRAPDAGGLSFWVGNLGSGMPREVALAEFMFSAEFRNFSQAIFGNPNVRAELNAVMDFYRGLLSRLPDNAGFNYWVQQFRAAQCQGQAAILAQAEAISSAFALSTEYTSRGRNPGQYVGDLYNAFLRRGGDLGGVQFWIGQVTTAAQTREQARVQFKNSAEFQQRVNAIITQGCMS